MAMPLGLPDKVSGRGRMLILLFAGAAAHAVWTAYGYIPTVGELAYVKTLGYSGVSMLAIALYFVYPRK